MNRTMTALVIAAAFAACKGRKEKKAEVPAANFFPVKAYISGQVAALDTAHFSFTKIETVDGRSDTATITGREVRTHAAPFLSLPDLSAPGIKDDYEVSHLYDDLQEAFIFTFTTKEDHPVRQENITVEPELNAEGKNDIRSIFADVWEQGGAVRKNMLWEADKAFQVTTTTDSPNGTTTHRVRVLWAGSDSTKKK